MTREEILAMPAGRELDTLISVYLFGAKIDKNRDGWIQLGNYASYPKLYSTDIAAAWEVVEKMKLQGHELLLKNYEAIKGWSWYACYRKDMEVYSQSAPEAVCKAAILATLDTHKPQP